MAQTYPFALLHWMEERGGEESNFFDIFREYVRNTLRLVSLTYDGVSRIHKMPDLVEILYSIKIGDSDGSAERTAKEAKENAQLAAEEIDSDFALLHAHSLIGVWGSLEAMVDNLVDYYLSVKREDCLSRPIFQRIKVHAATYELMSGRERRAYLINEAKRECKADLSVGLGQFEGFLDAIGLGGPVDPRIRKKLLEGQQIRNVIAHRGGHADARLIERCPDLGYEVGDIVSINRKQFMEIVEAASLYARTLLRRCLLALGADDNLDGIPPQYRNAPGLGGEAAS